MCTAVTHFLLLCCYLCLFLVSAVLLVEGKTRLTANSAKQVGLQPECKQHLGCSADEGLQALKIWQQRTWARYVVCLQHYVAGHSRM